MLRNVTVTLDEETARWARLEAARRDTSVSRLLGEILERHMEEEGTYRSAMEGFLSRRPRNLSGGAPYPRREDLYDR